MSARPFHKRYHSDALSGMMPLTLEERGAYQTILDLIYDRGGPIVDNERLLAGYMNVSSRKYRSVRDSLINKGKIYHDENGNLANDRAAKELVQSKLRGRKHAEHGAKGGRTKAENQKKPNKNNEDGLAKLKPTPSHVRSQSLDTPKGDAETLAKQVWDSGVSYLTACGLQERQARSIIGKWRKGRGDGDVLKIISHCQANGISDPVAYVEGVKKNEPADFLDYLEKRA